jgi:Asp-tRNA(Asn)/Glu-tRNA(Gln) amidotransferase A subunit family amidase
MTQRLPALTLDAAIAALRAGAQSSESLTRDMLDRIASTDANVQAWAFLDREHALSLARAADARLAAGVEGGPLAGIGIGVKDIVSTCDQPTQLGSPIFAGAQPAFDAECVVRLKRAGGFVLGKTVTTEFAYMQPGKTRNPWHAAHTPGGSSSGSAAAVALGQVPVALGTQTNGSIIRPAAYCGVVGFKPTKDALPYGGVALFSATLDTLGVFARTVSDCALMTGALAERGVPGSSLAPLERAPRLAWLVEFPWCVVSTEQRTAATAAVDALRRDGATVTPVSLPATCGNAHLVHRCIMLHEGAHELGALQQRERQRMSAKLNAGLDEGRAIDATSYAEALAQRNAIIGALGVWLAPYDAIVTPPAPGTAPAELTQTGDPACCTLWSLAGFPAVSIPLALAPNGLPLGLQLAAGPGRDDRLLAVAQWCEARLGFKGLV